MIPGIPDPDPGSRVFRIRDFRYRIPDPGSHILNFRHAPSDPSRRDSMFPLPAAFQFTIFGKNPMKQIKNIDFGPNIKKTTGKSDKEGFQEMPCNGWVSEG